MRFPGFWVTGRGDHISVSRYVFDETELSDVSGWNRAWQNEDPELPHGFVRPTDMLIEVCRRMGPDDAPVPLSSYSESCSVSDIDSFRILVLQVLTDLDLKVDLDLDEQYSAS
jgi:hypothetical protein